MNDLEHYKYRDCLITLNEMAAHQEAKDEMIDSNLVIINSYFLNHK